MDADLWGAPSAEPRGWQPDDDDADAGRPIAWCPRCCGPVTGAHHGQDVYRRVQWACTLGCGWQLTEQAHRQIVEDGPECWQCDEPLTEAEADACSYCADCCPMAMQGCDVGCETHEVAAWPGWEADERWWEEIERLVCNLAVVIARG